MKGQGHKVKIRDDFNDFSIFLFMKMYDYWYIDKNVIIWGEGVIAYVFGFDSHVVIDAWSII